MIAKLKYYFVTDQRRLLIILAMGGLIIFNIIFFFIPLIYGLVGSFYDWNPLLGKMDFIGVKNYVNIAASPLFKTSLVNTFLFSAGAVLLKTALALVIAVGINSLRKSKSFFRSMYFIPVIMPIVAIAIVWKWVYHPRIGLLNMLLSAFGIVGQNWLDASHALGSILIMSVWKDIGYAIIIFMAALLNIPNSVMEAASVDGVNSTQRFFKITLPLVKPTVLFIMVTSLIAYFQTFVPMLIMTKGGPGDATYVLGYLIYFEAFKNYRFGYASAISVVLFIIVIIITLIQYKLLSRGDD